MKTIVVDAMGADLGLEPVVEGVIRSLKIKDFIINLVGDSAQINPLLEKISSDYKKRIIVTHADSFIKMDESASNAIRRCDSSIYIGIDILRDNKADAIVSAGHSGATMSLATLRLGRVDGISRPAICTLMPTTKSTPSLILDAGANTDCKSEYLVDFALMGYEYAKEVLGITNPKVGLLANGEEDNKGNELTKEAFALLKNESYFIGNVEGGDIFNGSVDVIVCDGFIGNIVLKTSEGVAKTIALILKSEIKKSNIFIKLAAFILKGVFGALKLKTDYAEYGGAPLLGINKVVIISHGKSNARAIECAIYQALKAIDGDVCGKIKEAFAK